MSPALLFALTFPTILTLAYFQWLHGSTEISQAVYAIGKCIQFGFPIIFVYWFRKERIRNEWRRHSLTPVSAELVPSPFNKTSINLIIGVLFGLAVAGITVWVPQQILSQTMADRLREMVIEKAASMEIDTHAKFAAMTVFYVVCHSFLEEYYWRWFVFDELQRNRSWWFAAIVSSLGFMAHHVVVLGYYFGWQSPWTYALSLCIAVGGLFWAWLYCGKGGFRSAWLSHAIVDAGIFGVGMLMFSSHLPT